MKHHYPFAYFVAATAFALGMIPASAAAQAKKYDAPKLSTEHSKPAAHTADGHVDLSGMWIETCAAL